MANKKPLHRLPLDDWFDDTPHPHDSMPIATDNEKYDPPCSVEPQEEEENIHHKMYEIATSKYNPFSVGGSESIQDL